MLNKSARRIYSLLTMIVLACPIYTAWSIYRADRIVQHEESGLESYSKAIKHDPSDGKLWWMRGRLQYFSIANPDVQNAAKDYKHAVRLNPRLGQAWLDLADCYESLGRTDDAEEALQNALRVWTYSPAANWQAGNFYIMRGNIDKMYACFKKAGTYDSSKLLMAFHLTWEADADHPSIYKKLIPNHLPAKLAYLNFLVSGNELDLAQSVWKDCMASPVPDSFEFKVSILFPYLDKLLAQNRIEEALCVWREALKKSGIYLTDNRFLHQNLVYEKLQTAVNLIWNGSFEHDLFQGGFDWRFTKHPAVKIRSEMGNVLDGSSCIQLVFYDKNVEFHHMEQIIPVLIPGEYLLTFFARTENLTTDQTPYFEVRGFPDAQSIRIETEMFPPSSPWTQYSLALTIPPATQAVRLILRRKPSRKMDNRLNGSLWLDRFSIMVQNADQTRL